MQFVLSSEYPEKICCSSDRVTVKGLQFGSQSQLQVLLRAVMLHSSHIFSVAIATYNEYAADFLCCRTLSKQPLRQVGTRATVSEDIQPGHNLYIPTHLDSLFINLNGSVGHCSISNFI